MNKNLPTDPIAYRIFEVRGDLTRQKFAEKLGISPSYVTMMEKGERSPGKPLMELICEKFNVNLRWLIDGEGQKFRSGTEDFKKDDFERDFVKVPVYALVGAGSPKDLFEGEPIGFIPVKKGKYPPGLSALRVAGDSMEPTLKDGAEVLVDREAHDLIDGKIYVIYIQDLGIVIKKLFRGPGVITLRSDNPSMPEITVKPEDVVVQGMIVGVSQGM